MPWGGSGFYALKTNKRKGINTDRAIDLSDRAPNILRPDIPKESKTLQRNDR
jgi:hypothetical protein